MKEILLYSLLTGLTTGIGSLLILIFGQPGKRILAFYFGTSASIMVWVSFFDLFPHSYALGSWPALIIGSLLGILIMKLLEIKESSDLGIFMSIAIALHNIPEGMAIGSGFLVLPSLGLKVALAIGLHNIPEGIGVASALYLSGYSVPLILVLPTITGLFIPLGTFFSLLLGKYSFYWIPLALSLAGGAMVYLVRKSIYPEGKKLNKSSTIIGIIFGIIIMILAEKFI